MSAKIKTTSDLRAFLADSMECVKLGTMSVEKASQITKLAGQINESIYAETKVARVMAEAKIQSAQFGKLELHDAA